MAAELKGVVEAQQAALEAARRQQAQPGAGGGSRDPAAAAAAVYAAGSAKPHIAQLQQLVQDMRAELRQPPPVVVGPPAAPEQQAAAEPRWRTSDGWADGGGSASQAAAAAAAAQQEQLQNAWEELAATQRQLRQLQAAHDALLAQQSQQAGSRVEAQALQMELEHARRWALRGGGSRRLYCQRPARVVAALMHACSDAASCLLCESLTHPGWSLTLCFVLPSALPRPQGGGAGQGGEGAHAAGADRCGD